MNESKKEAEQAVDSVLRDFQKHIDQRFDEMHAGQQRLFELIDQLAPRRKPIPVRVKAEHIRATRQLGSLCPNCSRRPVLDAEGEIFEGLAEFDHFLHKHVPDADHTWLICTPCHRDLTADFTTRGEALPQFTVYQNRRKQLQVQVVLPFHKPRKPRK